MEEKPLLFDQTIKKIDFICLVTGINIKSRESRPTDSLKARIIYIFNFVWLYSDFIGEFYWLIDGVRTGKDFFDLTYSAPCVSLTFLSNLKSIFLVSSESHILKLIEILRKMERREKEREHTEEKAELVKKDIDFLHMVISAMNRMYVVVYFMFAMVPTVMMSVKYYTSGELELLLPFSIIYPFNSSRLMIWPFVYLHQIWSEAVVFLYICVADYFYYICCSYICTQFKLLQSYIENLIPKQENLSRKFADSEEFKAKFRELIIWHQDLIECTQILEIIYSKSTLLNFMTSSMIICLTGFNVMMVDDTVFIVEFVGFLFVSLLQVFLLCYFADLLTAASTELIASVYNSQWYIAEVSVSKKLLMIQTRSQEPCKLTAYGFADVNLNSFMRVLSTSWSYFALLQHIYGN